MVKLDIVNNRIVLYSDSTTTEEPANSTRMYIDNVNQTIQAGTIFVKYEDLTDTLGTENFTDYINLINSKLQTVVANIDSVVINTSDIESILNNWLVQSQSTIATYYYEFEANSNMGSYSYTLGSNPLKEIEIINNTGCCISVTLYDMNEETNLITIPPYSSWSDSTIINRTKFYPYYWNIWFEPTTNSNVGPFIGSTSQKPHIIINTKIW